MLMRSPKGGWHNVTAQEIERFEKAGWVKSSEEERQAVIAAKHAPADPPPGNDGPKEPPPLDLEQLRIQWQAKYGKKPHHLKSAETLRKEL